MDGVGVSNDQANRRWRLTELIVIVLEGGDKVGFEWITVMAQNPGVR